MSNLTYSIAKANLNAQAWPSGKFRLLLAGSGYTPNAAHQYVSDITSEATGVGYVRKELMSRNVVAVGANAEYRADNLNWPVITTSFKWAIVYFDVNGSDASDATAWLVCALDMGSQSLVAANFTLDFNGVAHGSVFEID